MSFLIASYLLTLSRVCALLDARRTASDLEELVASYSSLRPFGLYWSPEIGLCAVEEAGGTQSDRDSSTEFTFSFDKLVPLSLLDGDAHRRRAGTPSFAPSVV